MNMQPGDEHEHMTPNAVFLANVLERSAQSHTQAHAAAELRRLHEENEALLEALKTLVLATKDFSIGHYNEEVHDIALSKARAAIKQVEEKA